MTDFILSSTTTIPFGISELNDTQFLGVVILLVIWTITWKGLALWKSAQNKDKFWFIIMLIVNTMGILEIIYLILNRESRKPQIINPLAPKHFSEPTNPNLS